MAHSDYKHKEQKGSGYRVRYAREYVYDDEGRGGSKSLWEWFEAGFESADEPKVWLMNHTDEECYRLIRGSTFRFGIEDIAVTSSPDLDSRARRLVKKGLSEPDWNEYWQHIIDGYNRKRGDIEQRAQEKSDAQSSEWEASRQASMAKALAIEEEDRLATNKTVELSAGSLRAEFTEAFRMRERSDNDEGEWLEDATNGYLTGHGFGDEIRTTASVKLQITLSLDMSNSMYYNRIHTQAMSAFYDIGQSLRTLHAEYPNDLFTGFFEFSQDGYNGTGRGKRVDQLGADSYDARNHPDFGELYEYRPSAVKEVYGQGRFQGEDTYIYPLMEKIETWENSGASDTGAIRLDLVITDAVLEHESDIRAASVIQDRRDGSLQTILLNLMPESEWLQTSLPRHTFQYHVDVDNLASALRSLISEFVSIHL